jgi:4-hydroxybenzoate polyprenyltransferase
MSLIGTNIRGLLLSMRPRQWSKNLFVFAALLFSRNFLHVPLLLKTLETFAVFCLISGTGYLLNDIIDKDKDRYHPEKSKRPIASGMVSFTTAAGALIVVFAGSLISAFMIKKELFWIACAYFTLQTAYSFILKNVVILDVLSITAGFVLRVYAGALVIHVQISSWLIVCTFLLALFLALSKRRHELTILEGNAGKHRKVLDKYSIYLLDQMISIVTSSAVVAYALYTLSEQTIEKFNTSSMVFTVPFVIYGIFRYLYLVHMKQRGGSPEMMIITDIPLFTNLILWIVVSGIIIYT